MAIYVNSGGSEVFPYTSLETGFKTLVAAVVYLGGEIPSSREVIVNDGVWSLSGVLNIGGTLRSINGPSKTAIIGNGVDRVIYMPIAGGLLSGFRISGGRKTGTGLLDGGGGIFVYGESEVSDCIISDNICVNRGGGIFLYNGIIKDSVITGNSASQIGGGGAIIRSGKMSNCVIYGNSATNGGGLLVGGGLIVTGTNGWVRDSIVVNNTGSVYGSGGGVLLDVEGIDLSGMIIGNNINGNFEKLSWAGGFYNCMSNPIPSPGTGNILDSSL